MIGVTVEILRQSAIHAKEFFPLTGLALAASIGLSLYLW
jgi:hypothetical protein